ncbi:hypothetical protein RFI_11647 [Reticulomyxa filosa]|uniref:Uncharacterized protein n=1 Tax=Reticulomyxa filosa TaxID=46433 RepID=X6NHM1_RETFI|nr:hypothetical protein RFI_11647 [Reticulomyxa filosa]|eukprot:ETO25486.1 hypothetical protein RFI_11647 [Reticulomyxa filosa]
MKLPCIPWPSFIPCPMGIPTMVESYSKSCYHFGTNHYFPNWPMKKTCNVNSIPSFLQCQVFLFCFFLKKNCLFHFLIIIPLFFFFIKVWNAFTMTKQKINTELVKNALFRNLHQGNMNGFFIDLICFRPNEKAEQLKPIKEKLLTEFREWHFLEYLLDVSSSPKHGDDVATKYATFFIDLVARSASTDETIVLFRGHEHLIVDSMIKALLNVEDTRTLWHQVMCGQTLIQFLDITSRPTIINPAQIVAEMMRVAPPEPSPNVLHQLFNVMAILFFCLFICLFIFISMYSSLTCIYIFYFLFSLSNGRIKKKGETNLVRLHTYIPQLCEAIIHPSKRLIFVLSVNNIVSTFFYCINLAIRLFVCFYLLWNIPPPKKKKKKKELEPVPLAGGVIKEPLGQVRLNCLELLTVSADFAQFKCGKVLALLQNDFWKAILDMAFVHHENNLFLCHFRRLIHLCMIFRRRLLKYLFVECNMLDRLIDFYNNQVSNHTFNPKKKINNNNNNLQIDKSHCLHGYILQMTWDIFHHDQRDSEEDVLQEKKDETNDEGNESEAESTSSVIINAETDEEAAADEDNDPNSNDAESSEKTKDGGNDDDNKSENFAENADGVVLTANFSKDAEDQWSIVEYFEKHPKWSAFKQILANEIETQAGGGAPLPTLTQENSGNVSQLTALLDSYSDAAGDSEHARNPEEEHSSDSDVCFVF